MFIVLRVLLSSILTIVGFFLLYFTKLFANFIRLENNLYFYLRNDVFYTQKQFYQKVTIMLYKNLYIQLQLTLAQQRLQTQPFRQI